MKWLYVSAIGFVSCAAVLLIGALPISWLKHNYISQDDNEILRISNREINLGTIPEGDVVRVVFHLENSCNDVVRIRRTIASCACLDPQLEKSRINPGETAELGVVLDSRGRPGLRTGNILVEYDLPTEAISRSTRLFLAGRILAAAIVEPEFYDFGEIIYGKQYEAEFKIVSEMYSNLNVEKATGYLDTSTNYRGNLRQEFEEQFSVEWNSAGPKRCDVKLMFSPRTGLPSGAGSCRLVFTDKHIPERAVNFRWAVRSPLAFSRPTIVSRAEKYCTETLVVSPREGIHLEPFNASLHMLSAEMKEMPSLSLSRRLFEINVIKPMGEKSVSTGYIEFIFDDPEHFPMQRLPIVITWLE